MESRVLIREDGEVDATGVSTLVPWWSFTKTALAIALLRLSEQARVSLNEVVEGKPYTPVHLLRHERGYQTTAPCRAIMPMSRRGVRPGLLMICGTQSRRIDCDMNLVTVGPIQISATWWSLD